MQAFVTAHARRYWHFVALASVIAAASTAVLAVTKGPDAGGYVATDATVYSFIDIAGASGGTSMLQGTDDGIAPLTLPFAFRFYGQFYTRLCVSTNGAFYFVATESACAGINDFANTDLTTSTTPNDFPAILPLWSDLTLQVPGAGAVYYQTLGAPGSRKFILQWDHAYPQGSPNPVTFQAILSESDHGILFQYKSVSLGDGNAASGGAQATVGIRNAGALANQQQIAWSFDSPVVGDDTALLFTTAAPTLAGTITASPAQVCDHSGQGITTLTWTSPAGVTAVQVHLDSPTGPLFSSIGPNSSRATGKYMTEGRKVYLQNVSGGLPLTPDNTLAVVTVHVTTGDCLRTGTLSAVPNPMQVCDGTGQGITTLTWTASSVITAVQVHLDSPSGPLFSAIGPSGSKVTGKYMTENRKVFLQDVSGGLPLTPANTLATETVHVACATARAGQ